MAVCNSCGLELLKKIPEFPEIEKEVDLDTGLLKENAVQFYSSVLEAPSQEEVEGYIRYSAKKLNECGFTGVQSDDLASFREKLALDHGPPFLLQGTGCQRRAEYPPL